MRAIPVTRDAKAADVNGLDTLAKLATESHEVILDDRDSTIAQLQAQAQRHETVIDAIAQGICFFDAEERLIFSNRRYAEDLSPCARANPSGRHAARDRRTSRRRRNLCGSRRRRLSLVLRIEHTQRRNDRFGPPSCRTGGPFKFATSPMPGGGWVATHEDITELKAARAAANERLSLQALIDRLPDNLWVKDVNSRFVIANQVTADSHRRGGARGSDRQDRLRASADGARAEIL